MFFSACTGDSTKSGDAADAASLSSKPIPDFQPWTAEIAAGVGDIKQVVTDGKKGPIFVFQEFHTSRIGQLQIGVMLLRLHEKHGMKVIGLEGDTDPQKLNADWFHSAGGENAAEERKNVGSRMLSAGEISSSEFMALEFPDVSVHGIESAQEYGENLDVKGNPEVSYLLAIAERSISPEKGREVARLLAGNPTKANAEKAFDLLLNSDDWVKQRYEQMKATDSTSSEQIVARLHEIKAKAESLGVQPGAREQTDFDSTIHFYETASKRSATMVDSILRLARDNSGSPIAMIVGAAHSAKVAELLQAQGAAFALLSPKDLNPKYGSLSVEEFDRKSRGLWANNRPGSLGHVLNQHKPAPVIQRASGHSYASMNLASALLAKAARGGGDFPGNVLPQLSALPGFRIEPSSIRRDPPYDVIFMAYLTDDQGREKPVWARVGTVPPKSNKADLERQLLDEIDSIKGPQPLAEGGGAGGRGGRGGRGHDGIEEPPEDGASKSRRDADRGRLERGGREISRTGLDTLAVFGARREDVERTGHISS